jgi:4-amino-4-deoxy-L-arabinose transferase-like glycosyltransferase
VIQRANWAFLLVAVLLVAVHLFVFFANLIITPIGFDEAFNLQAPLNLLAGNGYSTEDFANGGPRLTFDAIVSTGPVVELPAAASMAIFGTSIEAARIVMLPVYGLLLVCLFILGRRIAGRWAGLVAAASVLLLDTRADWPFTVIYGPSDALGEYAAAAFIALALVFLPRHRTLAGLAIGLATLAKFIAFMAAPAFMIAMLLVPAAALAGALVRAKILELLKFAAAVLVPSVAWELVKVISLGPVGYVDSLVGYIRFVFRSGSGVDGSGRAFFLDRASRLAATWHLPTLLVILLFTVLLAVAVLGAWQWLRRPAGAPAPTSAWRGFTASVARVPVEVWAAAGTLAVFALWWSFIASSIFIRHTMPVLLCTVPLILALAIKGVRFLLAQPVLWMRVAAVTLTAVGVVTGVLQASATVVASTRPEDWTRAQQVAAADFVRDLGVDEVQGIGWWAAPEVRFLSHVPSTPVGTGTGPLVLEPIMKVLEPALYATGLGLCDTILYESDGFVVCDVVPGIDPVEFGVAP